ncbi:MULTISPECIES: hypothetical protein [Paenibacillus]|uniref:hypothetical protein n=1 Tax=Paenibacillus TaxID=44249 RepID=UPI000DA60A33|nr:hypothetical protein [Paenibacillus bouchesdurhonensis]
MRNIIYLLRDFAEDIFILAGMALINVATFQLHQTAGMYSLGVTLAVIGLTIARQPPKKE